MNVGVLPQIQRGEMETKRFNRSDEARQRPGIAVLRFERALDDLEVRLETLCVGIRFAVNGGP